MAQSNSSTTSAPAGATSLALSSASLQWLAITTMAIDHIGLYLLGNFTPFRIIGRLAMPIFVFLLVEGFRHTRSRPRYFGRILLFALIAELPSLVLSVLTHISISHNIMFNLALSLLALCCLERGKAWALLVIPLAAIAGALNLDYGPLAILMASAFYLVRRYLPLRSWASSTAILITLAFAELGFVLYYNNPLQALAIFAAFPLMLYGGQKGHRLPRYFSYVFYPAHLFVLMILRLIFY